ncbi:hypothetical protein V8C43DRAFT_168017 [Trichoderma afarasin]
MACCITVHLCESWQGEKPGRRIAAKVARLMHHKVPIISFAPSSALDTDQLQLVLVCTRTTDGTDRQTPSMHCDLHEGRLASRGQAGSEMSTYESVTVQSTSLYTHTSARTSTVMTPWESIPSGHENLARCALHGSASSSVDGLQPPSPPAIALAWNPPRDSRRTLKSGNHLEAALKPTLSCCWSFM